MRKLTVLALLVAVVGLAACGGSDNRGSKQQPTYRSQNFIERQIFNHRLAISDDPSTVLFCTRYPFDAPPQTDAIAGKLVSGTKRPDPPTNEADNNGVGTERQDAQGMYGPSVPYRFGFTPGGVYIDYTDIPTVCSTEAKTTHETSAGRFTTNNQALTDAGVRAHEALAAGLVYGAGHKFEGYTPESQAKAQAIIDNAVTGAGR